MSSTDVHALRPPPHTDRSVTTNPLASRPASSSGIRHGEDQQRKATSAAAEEEDAVFSARSSPNPAPAPPHYHHQEPSKSSTTVDGRQQQKGSAGHILHTHSTNNIIDDTTTPPLRQAVGAAASTTIASTTSAQTTRPAADNPFVIRNTNHHSDATNVSPTTAAAVIATVMSAPPQLQQSEEGHSHRVGTGSSTCSGGAAVNSGGQAPDQPLSPLVVGGGESTTDRPGFVGTPVAVGSTQINRNLPPTAASEGPTARGARPQIAIATSDPAANFNSGSGDYVYNSGGSEPRTTVALTDGCADPFAIQPEHTNGTATTTNSHVYTTNRNTTPTTPAQPLLAPVATGVVVGGGGNAPMGRGVDDGCGSDEDGDQAGGAAFDLASATMRVDVLNYGRNHERDYPNNSICTSKYTIVTFVPLNLFEQFRRLSNFYFLIVMTLTLIPGASPVNPFSAIAPLALVVGVAAVKDAFEDFRRHKSDRKANSVKAHVLRGGQFIDIPSEDVQVGDVLKIHHGEEIRADCVLLASALPEGVAYIETANLDGETNAKTKKSLDITHATFATPADFLAHCCVDEAPLLTMSNRCMLSVTTFPARFCAGCRQVFNALADSIGCARLSEDNEGKARRRADKDAHLDAAAAAVTAAPSYAAAGVPPTSSRHNGPDSLQASHGEPNTPAPNNVTSVHRRNRPGFEEANGADPNATNEEGIAGILAQNANASADGAKFASVYTMQGGEKYGLRIIAAMPDPNLSYWQGVLRMNPVETYALGLDNLLFRGAILRNTEWAYGAVVYSGVETKMFLNLKQKPPKRSQFDKQMNWLMLAMFILTVFLVVLFASLAVRFHSDNGDLWYAEPYVYNKSNTILWGWRFITHFILLSYLIPISLFITLEINKGLQVLFISMDGEISDYNAATREWRMCRPKTSNLTSQLGRVKYIFADKTGTLTENCMKFVGGHIDSIVFKTHDDVPFERQQPVAGDGGAPAAPAAGGPHASENYNYNFENTVAPNNNNANTNNPDSNTSRRSIARGGSSGRLSGASGDEGASMSGDVVVPPRDVIGADALGYELLRCGFVPSRAFLRKKKKEALEEKRMELFTGLAAADTNATKKAAGQSLARSGLLGRTATGALGGSSVFVHSRVQSNALGIIDMAAQSMHHARTLSTGGGGGGHARTRSGLNVVSGDMSHFANNIGDAPLSSGEVASDSQSRRRRNGGGVHSRRPSLMAGLGGNNGPVAHQRVLSMGAESNASNISFGGGGGMSQQCLERSSLFMYLLSLSACHNVVCFDPRDNHAAGEGGAPVKARKIYEGQSLDEVALVQAAADNFFELVERSSKEMTIEIMGRCYTYDIVAELEFTPQRKLMSIILKRNKAKDIIAHQRRRSYMQSVASHGRSMSRQSGAPSHGRVPSYQTRSGLASPLSRHPTIQHQTTFSAENLFAGFNTSNAGHTSTTVANGALIDFFPGPQGGGGAAGGDAPSGSMAHSLGHGGSSMGAAPVTGSVVKGVHTANKDKSTGLRIIDDADDNVFPYLMLTKGADSSMLPLIDMSVQVNQDMSPSVEESLHAMASSGLRTLVLGYRRLSQQDVDAFLPVLKAANQSMGDRNRLLHEAYAQIEKQFTLIGATAVEDKLQDGVPETIDFFVRAKVVVWMLTGDKRETAVTIAGTSGIIDAENTQEVIHIDVTGVPDEEKMREVGVQIRNAKAIIDAQPPNTVVLVIDGVSLNAALQMDPTEHVQGDTNSPDGGSDVNADCNFFDLGSKCRAAVCCRMTPLQKADVVRMFQTTTGHVALAIGDGANDVSMIQEAEIGVGIMGLEGAQAELASDFAIPKFRHLKRLMVVHGRHSLYRDANTVMYSIYKCIVIVIALSIYTSMCGYSGQAAFNSWFLSMYNSFYCQIQALAIGIVDKDLPAEVLEANPLLYPELAEKKTYFNPREWLLTIIEASLIGMSLSLSGITSLQANDVSMDHTNSLADLGSIWFIGIIMVMDTAATLRFLRSWTPLTIGTMIFGYAVLILFTFAICSLINFGGTSLAGVAWKIFDVYVFYAQVLLAFAGFFVCISLVKLYVLDELIYPSTSANKVVEGVLNAHRSTIATLNAKERSIADAQATAVAQAAAEALENGGAGVLVVPDNVNEDGSDYQGPEDYNYIAAAGGGPVVTSDGEEMVGMNNTYNYAAPEGTDALPTPSNGLDLTARPGIHRQPTAVPQPVAAAAPLTSDDDYGNNSVIRHDR